MPPTPPTPAPQAPSLPELIETEEALERVLSEPAPPVVETLRRMEGDLLILGIGGKMGPSLARLARRACDAAGVRRRIIGASRFSEPGLEAALREAGIETIACDLLDGAALKKLPDAPNVLYLAGRKFGSTGGEGLTWAMNAYLPGRVAERFPGARIVAFSTGNVYPLVKVASGGSIESDPPAPIGEYAASCVGRERVLAHFCARGNSPAVLLRLNYANDLRYGVLFEVARKVFTRRPVSLANGHVNLIWQGDANATTLRAFDRAAVPPFVLNLAGPETVSLRWLARRFGEIFGVEPILEGTEGETAFLSNAALSFRLFGYPAVSLGRMIDWQAHWIRRGGPALDKPTHFEEREGKY